MKCPLCPVDAAGRTCLGESIPKLCALAQTRNDYRRQLARLAQQPADGPVRGAHDLAGVLAEVAVCPERGSSLPATFQPDCGCSELTECRGGRGVMAGLVALQDCLACVVKSRGDAGTPPAS